MNKQSSKSSRSATSVGAPAGRASFARLVSSLILALSALAGLLPMPTTMPAPLTGLPASLALPSLRTAEASSFDLQVAIAGGDEHSCAIKNRALYCWGWNGSGQLGDGTTTQRTTPTAVQNMGSGVTAVAVGGYHTCAIKGGALYCWGYNGYGQIGDGTTTSSVTPKAVPGMGSGVTAVSAGRWHTCAIKDGALYCWGDNAPGQLGASSSQTCLGTPCDTVPLPVTNMGSSVTAVSAGRWHSCAIKSGVLYCWGGNPYGQLGASSSQTCYGYPCSTTPIAVTNMGSGVTSFSAGGWHTCAIKDGALYCWGENSYGQLGASSSQTCYGGYPCSTVPLTVTDMGSSVTAIATDLHHTCAIKSGALYCWGYNYYGQVGDGTTTNRMAPMVVSGIDGGAAAVGAGGHHSLGLNNDTCLHTWGWNAYGQLGDGTNTNRTTPVQVSGGCGWGAVAPGPFSKTAPVSGTVGLPITVTLSWSAPVTGTVHHYRYCAATTPGCTLATQVLSTTTSVTVTGLTPGATYHWQVRACAESTCTVFTDANGGTYWTFGVKPLPSQSGFNKSAPASGAPNVSTAPTLSWTVSGGAMYYQVCYDTTINGACNGTWQNVGNVISTTLSGLTPGTQYEWQVGACDDDVGCNGGADGGTWWTFTTATGPAGFSKASPLNGTPGLPTSLTLSWNSTTGQGAVTYGYCIKTVNAPCGASEWVNVGANTNSGALSLNPGTIYYWQARACDANGCTLANSGSFWSFQTAQAVGSFNKLAPGNGAINVNTNTAQLQWATASGATDYRVCLGTAVNNCNILGGVPGQYVSTWPNQFRILSDLPLQPNTTYYWQVLATNGVYTTFANGSAFSFWSFTTLPSGPEAFNKTAPVFNATNVPTSNVSFTWTPANNAVSYTVCVGAFAGDCSYSVTSTATSAVLVGPLPAGATLVWQVTAHNAAGTNNADNNAWWPLTVTLVVVLGTCVFGVQPVVVA